VDYANFIDRRIGSLESPQYRGTATRGRAQRHQHKATGVQRTRISLHGAQRMAQATQHLIEDNDVELLRGRILVAIRREKRTALVPVLLRHGDCAVRQIDSDIPRIARHWESAQQNALATSCIQHCPAWLQVANIARQYAEARQFGKLRKIVPPPCGILRFPGLRGLQQPIGPAAAVYDRLQPARGLFKKRMPAHVLSAHGARSVLTEATRNILWIMSVLPILCYHNVAMAPNDAPFKLLYVRPDSFERQLWTLRRLGLRGVSTSEGIARLSNGTSRGSVVLTFDDGYADTLTMAAPLMKQYGCEATCYVVSGAVGTHNHWDTEYLREKKPLMNRDQLDQWLAAGMEVGSHSIAHQRLHELPQEVARYEIAESRTVLRNMLGVPIEHFAYPFGSFTADIVGFVRHAGYSSAMTVLPGVARASDDRLRLPRILVNGERGLWKFLLQVAAPFERLRWRQRAR
jgi:peptidoglycan/xylan/chitin deacetylase (PgdA/CDA1 family)